MLSYLYAFDGDLMSWMDLSPTATGEKPPAIKGHGFAATSGYVYLFGGFGMTGAGTGRRLLISKSLA